MREICMNLGGLGNVLGGSWGVLWAVWASKGDETEKMSKKGWGAPPQGGGLGDPVDLKVGPRREGIGENID